MIRIFKTENQVLCELEKIEIGSWVCMTEPTEDEIRQTARELSLDPRDLINAVDPEEKNRVTMHEKYTLILLDIPVDDIRHEEKHFATIPMGIILMDNYILTICSRPTSILEYFVEEGAESFTTKKRMRFVYQIMLRTSLMFQSDLRLIDKRRRAIEEHIEDISDEKDLIALHELESTLVYFETSLRGNGNVLDRLSRYSGLQRYAEDKDMLEDVIIENQQAIEMTTIYRDIIDGSRELISSVMDLHLNNVMKRLTSLTVILAIPTLISGLYGMNVDSEWVPLAKTVHGFGIITLIVVLICVVLAIVLRKRKYL